MTNDETKLMIIENYIDWYASSEAERMLLKRYAKLYVDEDWVDEIQSRIDEVLVPVKEVLECIVGDANMALIGNWDCSSEGFLDQIHIIDSLNLIDVSNIVDES